MRPTLFSFQTRLHTPATLSNARRRLIQSIPTSPSTPAIVLNFCRNAVFLIHQDGSSPWRNQRQNDDASHPARPGPAVQLPRTRRRKVLVPIRSNREPNPSVHHGRRRQRPAWRATTPRFWKDECLHRLPSRRAPRAVRHIVVPVLPQASRACPRF